MSHGIDGCTLSLPTGAAGCRPRISDAARHLGGLPVTGSGADSPFRITDIQLDDRLVVRRSAEVEHEMAVAIYDLLEANHFEPVTGPSGPYHLRLAVRDGRRLVFDIRDEADNPLAEIALPLNTFRRIVKDYFTVCESYFESIRTAPPSRIEALDMGRRSLHDEGAVLLRGILAERVVIDTETSRRLFTLICVLHIRG